MTNCNRYRHGKFRYKNVVVGLIINLVYCLNFLYFWVFQINKQYSMYFICRLNISNLLIYKHIRKVTNNSPDLYHVLSSWCTRGAHPIIHFYIYTLAYISSGNCVLSYSVLAANTQKHEYKMLKVLLLLSLAAFGSARLTTSGTNLLYNGQKVFLSGVNMHGIRTVTILATVNTRRIQNPLWKVGSTPFPAAVAIQSVSWLK